MGMCMFGCVFFLLSVDGMVMSSAYEVGCIGAGGCGMFNVYMLKSVDERASLK